MLSLHMANISDLLNDIHTEYISLPVDAVHIIFSNCFCVQTLYPIMDRLAWGLMKEVVVTVLTSAWVLAWQVRGVLGWRQWWTVTHACCFADKSLKANML